MQIVTQVPKRPRDGSTSILHLSYENISQPNFIIFARNTPKDSGITIRKFINNILIKTVRENPRKPH